MESKDTLKTETELIVDKMLNLEICKEPKRHVNGFKTSGSDIHQDEKGEINENIADLIEERPDVKLNARKKATELNSGKEKMEFSEKKESIEFIKEKKYIDDISEKGNAELKDENKDAKCSNETEDRKYKKRLENTDYLNKNGKFNKSEEEDKQLTNGDKEEIFNDGKEDKNLPNGKEELNNMKENVHTNGKEDEEFTNGKEEEEFTNGKDEEFTNGKEEDFINEKEGIEYNIEKDVINRKGVKHFSEKEKEMLGNEKGEVLANEKESTKLNFHKENGNLSPKREVVNNEKEYTKPTDEKNCIENGEIIGKNFKTGDNLLKLDANIAKALDDMKITDCEAKNCTESGSDSKISTSSTGKGSSSYSGSKSGIEDRNSNESFKIPSDTLIAKIVRQAEFYFSDFNLLKNNFLLKHVRRNKEGYVSLKLVASFRKIKSMTRDWRVVVHSLEFSKMLEMNSEKSKIRRIAPIPKVEETSLGKTVIVFNLPFQNPTSEELREMFSKFGNIVHAEIMSPRSEKYNTYHKRCRYHNPEVSSTIFGSVEFEKFEDAVSAIKDEESHLPKENKMKVVALVSHFQRRKRRNSRFNQYNNYPRWISGGFKSRYDYQNDQMMHGVPFGDYPYARPMLSENQYRRYYPRSYPKAIHSSSSTSEIPDKLRQENYVESGEDGRSSSYARSRQLKLSNRMNINRQYPTHQPRYIDGHFGYRETNFET